MWSDSAAMMPDNLTAQAPRDTGVQAETDVKSEPPAPATDRIVVLSGPSGSGKTTIVNRLLAASPIPLRKSVSATTRPAHPGERDGEDYHFLTSDEFKRRRRKGEFLESAEVHKSGYWYGTLTSEVERAQQEGTWAFLEIDVEGALAVIERYPGAVTIFLLTPSDTVYEQRLRDRGTEAEGVIQRRLQTAREELKFADRYRFRVVNDNLDDAVHGICKILAAEAT